MPGGWSIAVEMTFYAVFPALAFWIVSWRRVAIAFVLSILFMMICNHFGRLAFFGESDLLVSNFLYFWFFNQAPVFVIGIAVFFALRDFHPSIKAVSFGLALSAAAIIMLPFLPLRLIPLNGHLKYALCFAFFAFYLGRGGGRYLVNWPIRQLGKISYSSYLWQFAVLKWLEPLRELAGLHVVSSSWLYALNLMAAVSATAALSTLTYRMIERPMIALGTRFIKQRIANRNNLAPALNA